MIASFRCPGSPRPAASDRPGYALLAVLIVVAVLSLVAYQFTDAMTSEYVAASRTTDVVQSRLNAISGISYAAALLTDAGSTGINPYEDASLANVPVAASENPRKDARFALVAVGGDATSGFTVRNGVTDEGGKINLNALIQLDSTGQLLHDALMALPNMTEDIADAIVDWVDPDDTERPAGAESGYYLGLEQPYRAKNGPMNTLDELLLVRGVTWQLLYGNDRNRNGIADDTPGGSQTLDRGWAEYLTVYGRELNSTSSGEPRLYLGTSDDLVTFHSNLVTAIGQEMADYILAYKLFDVSQVPTSSAGPSASSSSQSGSGSMGQLSTAVQSALAQSPQNKRQLPSILSLVGTQVTLPNPTSAGSGNSSSGSSGSSNASSNSTASSATASPSIVIPCPLNDPARLAEELPVLLDATTGRQEYEMVPRINVMTAPREVLMALTAIAQSAAQASAQSTSQTSTSTTMTTTNSSQTGSSSTSLDETDVDAILAARDSLSPTDPDVQSGAWVVTQANVTPKKFAQLERYITSRSMVYRVQSIGYFSQNGPVARVEAVIDTHLGTPRILYYRDLTDLDIPRGFTPPR